MPGVYRVLRGDAGVRDYRGWLLAAAEVGNKKKNTTGVYLPVHEQ